MVADTSQPDVNNSSLRFGINDPLLRKQGFRLDIAVLTIPSKDSYTHDFQYMSLNVVMPIFLQFLLQYGSLVRLPTRVLDHVLDTHCGVDRGVRRSRRCSRFLAPSRS